MVPTMTRAAPVLLALLCACGRSADRNSDPPEAPRASVHYEAVALELEIYEPHDGTTVSRPMVVAELGSPAAVSTEFTLRPARKQVRRLDIEMTPTRVVDGSCELDVRSQVLDDPRLRIAAEPQIQAVPIGEWVDLVTLDMVAARVRCSPPPSNLARLP
jgi:hypothetical protein